ncbi:hypothetical protein C8Q77DRAFT_393203 [Trametes polyzona]|nr:hypothetical protein C8Q77DRAFT_393203 [Trametes polyzona]
MSSVARAVPAEARALPVPFVTHRPSSRRHPELHICDSTMYRAGRINATDPPSCHLPGISAEDSSVQ